MSELVNAATAIARRVAQQATWHAGRCHWNVPDGLDDGRSLNDGAAANLYTGSVGIGLFFLELAAATQESAFALVADGALNHALANRDALPRRSMFLGWVGLAYVLARAAELTGSQRYFDASIALISDVRSPDGHPATDVIGGDAGVIPALLAIGRMIDRRDVTQAAIEIGERLIATARRRSIGWSWRSPGLRAHDLTGFAHGAAGYATAFSRLAMETGDGRYAYAAERCYAYEDRYFDRATGNWTDHRYPIADGLLEGDAGDSARAQIARDSEKARSMLAWCHGAVGCMLARAISANVLPSIEQTLAYQRGMETVLRAIPALDDRSELSLCHGVAGNADVLAALDDLQIQPGARRLAAKAAHAVADRIAQRSTVRSAAYPGAGPTLMLGEAGVGWWLLRMHDRRVPTILAPSGSSCALDVIQDSGYDAMRREDCDLYFPGEERSGVDATNRLPALAVYHRIVGRGGRATSSDRGTRSAREGLARVELELGEGDLALEALGKRYRPAWAALAVDAIKLRRSPRTRVLLDATEDEPRARVLVAEDGVVIGRDVRALCAIMMDLWGEPMSLKDLCGAIAVRLDCAVESLAPLVSDQAANLYAAGWIEVAAPT